MLAQVRGQRCLWTAGISAEAASLSDEPPLADKELPWKQDQLQVF